MGISIQVSPRVRLMVDGGADEVLACQHDDFTVEQLGLALLGAEVVRRWRDGVHKRVDQLMRAGTEVPGWRLAQTFEALRWRDDSHASSVLRARDLDPTRVMTPREFLRAHGEKVRDLVVALAEHPAGTSTIAPAAFKGCLLNDDAEDDDPPVCRDL